MDLEKRIQKDWDLIKDFDILEDIEDLRKLYQEKPYGKCLRKYTAYPWSKENFFFGDNAELNEYYKTTTDIPFYLQYKVGKKFHSLTALDFYRDENNVLMVKCCCDCGREVARKWESVNDGNSRTCGCILGQGRKTSKKTQKAKSNPEENVLKVYPELVKDEWDYQKNAFLPQNISIHSNKLIWWKPKYGKPFQSTIQERTKPVSGTSFPEQAIFYFIKSIFPDAINRAKYPIGGKVSIEFDIYIPSIKVAIEYDGLFWHKEKFGRDEFKNILLARTEIYLIRIRESSLDNLNTNFGDIIYHAVNRKGEGLRLHEVINEITKLIKIYINNKQLTLGGDIYKRLIDSYISKEDLIKNRTSIYGQYLVSYQKENITKTCLIQYWDFEKNGTLLPQNVDIHSNIYVVLTCAKGRSIYVQPSQYNKIFKSPVCENCFLCIEPYRVKGLCQNCGTFKKKTSISLSGICSCCKEKNG